jgi:hypothetical protein
MAIPATKQPETFLPQLTEVVAPLFRCESCGQAIGHRDDVVFEQEYGFEGEFWGSACRQEIREVALTRCCRAPILYDGEAVDAYQIREEL